ncbi:GNAT family N-acetyltransferase [Baekduia soli]|uniref:GNAT family N-acetyltransferase n=1 Tax=Baekduia soli TaxID=496014 RepID=A0A5B8UA47_9ACTN|nr:GNAT family N-acetyltransferase [Baekduia soli]QEC50079.1 GNAT family N-acetyltransferase [Baekduia soli]
MSLDAVLPAAPETAPAGPAAPAAGVVRVVTDLDGLAALRDAWARLPWDDLEADLDVFALLVNERESIVAPHVLVLERDGEVRAMAMARLEDRVVAARVGARTLVAPRLRCITVVHGGVASLDPGAEAVLIDALWRAVRRGDADAVYLHRARVDGPLRAACARWPRALRPTVPSAGGHWRLNLPGTFEDYVAGLSSRTRRSVRKQARELEAHFGAGLVVHRHREPGDLDALVADLESIASRSYQRGLGGGFRADAERRAMLALGLERGWVRAWVLHLDGVPVAFEVGHRFRDTFFGAATGFHPDYGRLRVGTYVQMRMVEDLCAERGVRAIDLGYGDAGYKQSFADERWEDADVTLLGPRPRALAAGAALAAAAGTDRLARRALGEGRLMTHLRRRRRQRAQAAG